MAMGTASGEIPGKAAEYLRILREHLPELRERYGVASLGIFGSYVRGEQQANSDLDVLVEYARATDLFDFVALKLALSELLGVNVDLVMRKGLKPRIGERILAEAVPV